MFVIQSYYRRWSEINCCSPLSPPFEGKNPGVKIQKLLFITRKISQKLENLKKIVPMENQDSTTWLY